MTLKKGQKYDVCKLRLLSWKAGSKAVADDHDDVAGYSLFSYFDDDGRYLGPDAYGIEPVVDLIKE